jgi:hypothetical protein
MPKPNPGERIVFSLFEVAPSKEYQIVHLNKHDSKTPGVLEGTVMRDVSIASYWLGRDRPQGYFIVKSHNPKEGQSDFLVVPEEGQVEEKLYNLALKRAQNYAKEKDLKLEDKTNFIPDPGF